MWSNQRHRIFTALEYTALEWVKNGINGLILYSAVKS